MKRLEKSRFKWPLSGSEAVLQLTEKKINWLLDGYPLTVTQANGSLPHNRVLWMDQQHSDNETKDGTADLPASSAGRSSSSRGSFSNSRCSSTNCWSKFALPATSTCVQGASASRWTRWHWPSTRPRRPWN